MERTNVVSTTGIDHRSSCVRMMFDELKQELIQTEPASGTTQTPMSLLIHCDATARTKPTSVSAALADRFAYGRRASRLLRSADEIRVKVSRKVL